MTEVWNIETPTQAPITVKVNGELVSNNEPGDRTLEAVLMRYAGAAGLKSFTARVNGRTVQTSEGGQTLSQLSATSIEITAKDSRGC